MQMRGQIAVAEIEPRRLAEARHVGEGVKALVAEAPAPGGVKGAGERIADVSRSGETCSPQTRASSPVLTITVSSRGPISRARTRASLAAPVPPARATMFTDGDRT